MSLILVGKGPVASEAVRVRNRSHGADYACHLSNIIDGLAVGIGKDNCETGFEAVFHGQLPGMVGRVPYSNIVGFKVLELRKGTKQLHALYCRRIDAGSRIDETVERIGDKSQQLGTESEIRVRKLIQLLI